MKLTKEQCDFYLLMKGLNEAKKNSDLKKINDFQTIMWSKIKNFARSEMYRMLKNSKMSPEDYSDLEQELALTFFENLPNYNPLISTPTTYFVRHFRHVISLHIRNHGMNLTQYDANNSRKVNKCIHDLEAQGIKWTYDMLSQRTGLSVKVIKSTMYYASNAVNANVEEAYSIEANIPTPEQAFEEKESMTVLYERIKANITQDEFQLLIMRINPEERKEMPYEKMANLTGMPIRQVKSSLNKIICKLSQDKALRSQFGNYNQYRNVSQLKMANNAASIMEEQMIEFLKSKKSGT